MWVTLRMLFWTHMGLANLTVLRFDFLSISIRIQCRSLKLMPWRVNRFSNLQVRANAHDEFTRRSRRILTRYRVDQVALKIVADGKVLPSSSCSSFWFRSSP
jgi:hypothetical protein